MCYAEAEEKRREPDQILSYLKDSPFTHLIDMAGLTKRVTDRQPHILRDKSNLSFGIEDSIYLSLKDYVDFISTPQGNRILKGVMGLQDRTTVPSPLMRDKFFNLHEAFCLAVAERFGSQVNRILNDEIVNKEGEIKDLSHNTALLELDQFLNATVGYEAKRYPSDGSMGKRVNNIGYEVSCDFSQTELMEQDVARKGFELANEFLQRVHQKLLNSQGRGSWHG